MIDEIPPDWRAAISNGIDDASLDRLGNLLSVERARTDTEIYPPERQVFAALRLMPLASVRAVIVGQDPYHGKGEAHGLAFSVPSTKRTPPSLLNILTEWDADIGGPRPFGGSLEPWARHGVLLLNVVLTVRRGEPNSHRGLGWHHLTTEIIKTVSAEPRPIAFLLWGQSAQRFSKWIAPRHVVAKSSHPSPLSATRGDSPFSGSKPFTTVNDLLKGAGEPPIDWSLADLG